MNYTVKVEGMSCQGCAKSVKAAFTKLAGVQEVKVNLDDKEVTLVSQTELSEERIGQSLDDTSYTVISVEK